MSYFEDIDAWLTDALLFDIDEESEEQWFERFKKQIKEKLLESYRNGQKTGVKAERPHREEKPRSNFHFLRKSKRQ